MAMNSRIEMKEYMLYLIYLERKEGFFNFVEFKLNTLNRSKVPTNEFVIFSGVRTMFCEAQNLRILNQRFVHIKLLVETIGKLSKVGHYSHLMLTIIIAFRNFLRDMSAKNGEEFKNLFLSKSNLFFQFNELMNSAMELSRTQEYEEMPLKEFIPDADADADADADNDDADIDDDDDAAHETLTITITPVTEKRISSGIPKIPGGNMFLCVPEKA
jgi:hypothetical protein